MPQSSHSKLFTLLTFSLILVQVHLTLKINLNQKKYGSLDNGQTQYYLLSLNRTQIGSDSLAFKVNSIKQFSDPDVIIAVNQQKEQFNITSNALKTCESWGQDICILQNSEIQDKKVQTINIAVACEFDCAYEIVVERLAIQLCLPKPEQDTTLTPQERLYSHQCQTFFDNQTDIRAVQFYVPSLQQYPNAKKIKHLTFLAHNYNFFVSENSPKIDLWVAPGNNIPESDCSCRRGYTLFSRSIGTRISGNKIKLGSNYTMLIQQILPNKAQLQQLTYTDIQMLVELQEQVVEIGQVSSLGYIQSFKQGIVDPREESCFKYNIKDATSDMVVILKVHTGYGTLYVGAGNPNFKDRKYQKDAYYQNQNQFNSYEEITPLERGKSGQTGYQYLCFYGLTASTFSISIFEQDDDKGARLVTGNRMYEFEIQQNEKGLNAKDLMFISSDVQSLEDLNFKITTKQSREVEMFVKPCDLAVSRSGAKPQSSFEVTYDSSGRIKYDLSVFWKKCRPTEQEMNLARQGSKNTNVMMATTFGNFTYTGQFSKTIKIQQQCKGELVQTTGQNFSINACGYWIHILNLKSTPTKFKLQTKLYADDYEGVLSEQQIQTYQLNRGREYYLAFSVSDTKAQQIRVQIDPIHGDTDMYISKWVKPTDINFQFRSTRCGRVPDVITIDKNKIKQYIKDTNPDDDENNPLVGQYYILILARQDSNFNIVYSVKSQSQDDSDVTISSIVHLKTNHPFSASLTTTHMLFMFNGDFDMNDGDDIRITVSNVETNEQLYIYATPVKDFNHPPATIDDYKFKSTILHPNYIIIKSSDDVDLKGSFYVRVQRKINTNKPIQNGVKFRINIMTGNREFNLRNGESEQAFILPKEANTGSFFVYHQLNPRNDLHINLNRLNGDRIKMFVGVGVENPSAEGDQIIVVQEGEYLRLNITTIENLNPKCRDAIKYNDENKFGSLQRVADECSIHIGVFPKVVSSFLMKQIDFSIKVMEENTINLSALIDGKSEKGFFNRNTLNPELAQSHTYSYKVPQFPQIGLYLTLVDYSRQNNKNLFFIAQIIPIDDKNTFSLTMLNQKSPEFGDKKSWSYKSSDFAMHHYLKISSGEFKRKQCNSKACYVLITVCSVSSQFDQKYQILAASKVQNLPDQSLRYGDVLPGYYSYFIYHNTCYQCTVRLFLNTISPGSGDADMFVNYSYFQNLQELPTKQNFHFGDKSYKEEKLVIDKEKMKSVQKDDIDFTMAGYYLIGVYGGDKKEDQEAVQPMIHFSIRASTKSTDYILMDEGINQGIKNVQAGTKKHFIWQNWGASHFNVYVTPTIGDVDIWVKSYFGMTLDDVQSSFPKQQQDATYSSNKKKTRNKLQINIDTDMEQDEFCVADCYFLITVRNKLSTDYDIYVDTLRPSKDTENNTDDVNVVDKFLPQNSIITQTCWMDHNTIYTVPFYRYRNQQKKMYLKISKSVSYKESIQYDIGTTRGGHEIEDDGVSDYKQINLENTVELGDYFNIYIQILCFHEIQYSIQVKKDWRIPIQITTNQPLSSTIYRSTVPDIYSFKYTQEMKALQVTLIKSKECDLNLLIQIYPDDIFNLEQYNVPTNETAHYRVESDDQNNYKLLHEQIDLSKVTLNSQIVFQVLYGKKKQINEEKCGYTLQLDAGAVVKMLIEDVFYQGSIKNSIKNKYESLNQNNRRVYQISNPYFSLDDKAQKELLTVEVRPCDQAVVGVFLSHQYLDTLKSINKQADNYSENIANGKITLHIRANQPQYYIYLFKLQPGLQKPAIFFVRAYYGDKHKQYTLGQHGKIQIVGRGKEESGDGVTVKWGQVYRIQNKVQTQPVDSVRFVVKGLRGQGLLKSQCEMRADDSFVIAYLQNTYEIFINYQDHFRGQYGITINVEAVPNQQWTESLFYEALYLKKVVQSKRTLWVYLTIIFGVLALFAVILAIVFRKNLKKTESQLEFEMTDVRNVARINRPSAAPYYNVEEEEAESDNKSGILKDSNDQEMKI